VTLTAPVVGHERLSRSTDQRAVETAAIAFGVTGIPVLLEWREYLARCYYQW
jgi:hypothetical protein